MNKLTILLLCVQSLCFSALHLTAIDELCARINKKFEKEKTLKLSGQGGKMATCIDTVYRSYQSADCVEMDQAKSMLMETAQVFKTEINQSASVKPHLKNYPFTFNDLELEIDFIDPKTNSYYPPPHIAMVSLNKGTVRFYTSSSPGSPFTMIHHEAIIQNE